jgi:hypothetical protein
VPIESVADEDLGKNMTLQEVDAKWSAYLAGDRCPTVLGLAPLSEEESREIHELVVDYSRSQPSQLFQLLETFSSGLAVWLARKAGEAYEAGAFWEKFAELVGVPVPMHRRDEFAKRFRRACRNTMSSWLPPEDLGGHNIVAEFLYQAGLPLERCERFAQHVRKVERTFGLPDADIPDSGEQLREAMLDSLQAVPEPTLKRASPLSPRWGRGSIKDRIINIPPDFSWGAPRAPPPSPRRERREAATRRPRRAGEVNHF